MSFTPESLSEVYQNMYNRLYGFALTWLHDEQAAENIVQEVFADLCNHPEYTLNDKLLFRMAKNAITDTYRREKRYDGQELSPDYAATDNHVNAYYDESSQLPDALSQLTPDQKYVLYLEELGYTKQEIAEIMKKSLPAVKIIRFRAVKKIKGILGLDE